MLGFDNWDFQSFRDTCYVGLAGFEVQVWVSGLLQCGIHCY